MFPIFLIQFVFPWNFLGNSFIYVTNLFCFIIFKYITILEF